MLIIHYIFNFILLITNSIFLHKFLHIYQLKSYSTNRYLSYFINIKSIFYIFCFILFIFQLFFNNILFYLIFNIIFYILNICLNKKIIKTQKTPLKITKKLSRIYIFSIFIFATLSVFHKSFPLMIALTPLIPPLANFINFIDKIINLRFIAKSKEKLKNSKVKVIAITGSNGKTSVKNILCSMLSTQYQTQATPASFNTPLGIAKFINNELKFSTDYLILEYGARHKKDIKKLCSIYGADYGVITTISPQHLGTFKSMENIYKAKKQLSEHLQNKPCVYNIDNIYTKRMFNEKCGERLSSSIFSQADIFADNIKIKDDYTFFDLHIQNQTFQISTKLLGRHNISNICECVTLASYLGIKANNIIKAINNLTPTPHRLNLIKTNINIFDDSYNCSIASAIEALWVLKQFKNKKMVVTPGIIEGGHNQFEINYELGKNLRFCDFCVIVGEENKLALTSGISQPFLTKQTETNIKKKAVNFQPQKISRTKILYAKTLEDAKRYFSYLQSNDNLLLLNDLPDDYS